MTHHTPKSFIENMKPNLVEIANKHQYYSFGLICSGIEFLGKCLDESNKFDYYETGLPRKQFNLAIKELMPQYSFIPNLYGNLRNGLLHSMLPKKEIWLSSRPTTHKHLDLYLGRFIIIAEDFGQDFSAACDDLIRQIDANLFTNPKMYDPILEMN